MYTTKTWVLNLFWHLTPLNQFAKIPAKHFALKKYVEIPVPALLPSRTSITWDTGPVIWEHLN